MSLIAQMCKPVRQPHATSHMLNSTVCDEETWGRAIGGDAGGGGGERVSSLVFRLSLPVLPGCCLAFSGLWLNIDLLRVATLDVVNLAS